MRVKRLIELLRCQDPEAEVLFAHQSGDFWKTELASMVERVGMMRLEYTQYHDSWSVPRVSGEGEDTDDKDGVLFAVVLR
jgi:hypothetical protein